LGSSATAKKKEEENAELNPIYHFLALLGANPILHVSGVMFNDHITS